MLNKLAFTLMVISVLSAYCHKGCLKCTPENECLYCDASQFYKLTDGRCVASPIDNCLTMDERGRCINCAENYYIDPIQFTCIALPSSFIVTNCAVHVAPRACSNCKIGFVLKNGVCEASSNVIQNCSLQNAKGKCLVCNSGFMRNATRDVCVAIPGIDNCSTYSNVECKSCSSGYLMNPNRYLNIIFGFKNTEQLKRLNRKLSDEISNTVDNSVFTTCQSINLTNCKVPLDFETCARCNPGYYVNYHGKCSPNPLIAIPNCNKYVSAIQCIDCKQGYFLESSTKCKNVTPLINCLIYETNTRYSSCKRCIDEYYLNADNICRPRTELSKIDFCTQFADEGERCDRCLNGYELTSDKLRCLPKVENCEVYVKSTINSLRLECTVCAPGYYFNNTYKVCSKGTVQSCQTYEITSDNCAVCEPNFYLVSNTCLPHNQLPLCVNYSKAIANTCVECRSFTFLFTPINSCVSVNIIDNCKNYASKTTCAVCNDGFYLINPSECKVIPAELNCLQLDANQNCVKCLSNYVTEAGKCFGPPQYILKNCENSNMNGIISSSDLKCNFCKPNHIPINFKETYVCQDKDYLKRKYLLPQQQFDNNCLQFAFNSQNDQLECVRCDDSFVLEGITCVKSCTNSARMTVYKQHVEVYDIDGNTIDDSYRIVKTNVCNTTIPNCAVAVPNINTTFENPTYACMECVPGYFKAINIGGPTGILPRPGKRLELLDNQYGTSPLTLGPGIQCIKPDNDVKVIGETSTLEFVDGCDYFQMIFPNLYGCNKCKWGMSGVVVDLIKNCSIFTNSQTCTQCQAGFYLKSAKECTPVTDILNCTTYDGTASSSVCTQCIANFYLNANGCVARVNSLDVNYSTPVVNSDSVTCNDGYKLDTNTAPYTCKKLPHNCITATIAASVITCTACKRDIAYLSGGNCVDGTVTGCAEYALSANECNTCANGRYRVNATTCSLHATGNDSLCSTWHQTTQNLCSACNYNAVRLQIKNKCLPVYIQITNCTEYVNIYQCKTCETGFYLDNLGRTCRAIAADLYCDTYVPIDINSDGIFNNSDLTTNKKFLYTCSKCTSGYYKKTASVTVNLLAGGTATKNVSTCYNYLEFARSQCVETDVDGTVDFGSKYCTGCATNYFPYDFNNKYVCVERSYVNLKETSFDTNCEVITYDNSDDFKCLRCKFGYFIKNNNNGSYTNECVTSCNNTVADPNNLVVPYIHYYEEDGTDIIFETGVCKNGGDSVSETSGAYYQRSMKISDQSFTTVISKCKDAYIPVLTYTATDYFRSFIDPNGSSYQMISPFDGFEAINSCVAISTNTVTGYLNIDNKIENCEFYHNIDTNLYGCMKCKFGYRGRVKGYSNAGAELNFGFIEYCEPFTDCNQTVNSGMFDTVDAATINGLINRYFSCFRCIDVGTNKVVIAAVGASTLTGLNPGNDFAAIYGLREYKLGNANNAEAYNANVDNLSASYSNFCTDAATLNTDLELASTNLLITNCSAYYLNVDSTGVDADVGLICAACLPGFAPTYDTTLTFMITSCNAIQNCNSPADGNVLNKCINCVQEYSIYTDIVNYGKCIDVSGGVVTIESCFAAYNDNNCSICRPGYELDTTVDDQATCYKVTVPECSDVNFYDDFSSNYALSTVVRDTALYLYTGNASTSIISGCTACDSATDVLLLNNVSNNDEIDPKVCVSGTDNRRTTSVANCTRVGWDYNNSKYICRQCNNTYILTEDNYCTSENPTRLPFCKIAKASDSDICLKCISARYVIVGGVCLDTQAISLPVGLVEHCDAYSAGTKDLAMGVCQKCAATYYLYNNSCISIPDTNCADYDAVSGCLVCKNNHALFKLSGKNICIDLDANNDNNWDYDSNCSDIVVDDANIANDDIQTKYLVCNTCKAHTVLSTVVANIPMASKCTNIVTTVDAQCSSYDIQALLSNSTFNCTACSNYNTHYLNPFTKICTARTIISNCATYDTNSNTCVNCNSNYKLNYTKSACDSLTADVGSRALNHGYIHTCRVLDSCNTELFYEGLDADLETFYSCHACKKADEIPFIAVRTDAAENRVESLNEYGFNANAADPLNKGTAGLAVQCLKPVNTNFNIASSANFVFPSNCALGLIKTNFAPNANKSSLASTDLDKSTVMCSACKPGYKAIGATRAADSTSVRYMVSSCTLISNCEHSRWFNACTQCKPNYSFSYNLTTGINFDECVVYTENPQCYSVHVVGAVKICKECKKGSYLNKDGICDLINPPRCEHGSFKLNQMLPSKDLKNGLIRINNGVGCNRCVDGFSAIYTPIDTHICTESLYLVNKELGVNTGYIQNCLNYTKNPLDVILCAVCKQNYTRTIDGKCVSSVNVSNCMVAQSSTVCNECVNGFVLVDRKCETPKITNCVEYHYDLEAFEQVCKKCGPEYYLTGNKCVGSNIRNCKFLESKIKCNECNEGFTLVLGDNGKSFCYPNSPKTNCRRFNIDKFQAGELECIECINSNYVISTSQSDFQPTFCMPFTNLERCELFNNSITLSLSSFECQRCHPNYYLTANICLKRTIKPTECTQYNITSDRCTACAYGYYADTDGTNCIAYPQGIQGCITYKSKSECLECDTKMYLKDNACVQVTTELDNCIYYEDKDICKTCLPSHLNVKGKCVVGYAQNCSTFASLTECKTCSAGFGLKRENTLLNCVSKNVQNCSVSEDIEPFNCLICSGEFYPLNGVCTVIAAKIENCVEYDSASTCTKCANRTALSVDRLSCINTPDVVAQVDLNCTNPLIVATPICNTCRAGYVFKFGKCIACITQTLNNGCYTCSSDKIEKCLMCASGFFMTAEGDCISVNQIEDSEGRIEGPVTISKIIADGHTLTQ